MNLGVGGGGVRPVLAHEAVDQAAGGPAGERARQLGPYEQGVGQRLLVQGVGAGLLGGEEGGAELGGTGPGREDGGDLAAAHDAAGGDDGQAHGLPDLREEGEQPDARPVRLRVVPMRPLMPAGLHSLHDHGIGTGPLYGEGLVRCGHGDEGEGAGAAQGLQHIRLRHPEVERDDRHRVVEQHGQLGVVPVVPPAVPVPQLRLVPGGLTGELMRVDVHGRGVGILGLRHEQVDPEGPARQAPQLLDLLVHPVGGFVPGGEEPQPTCLGHGSGELRHGDAARHGGLHDRVGEEIGQRGGHDGMLSRPPNKSESALCRAMYGACPTGLSAR